MRSTLLDGAGLNHVKIIIYRHCDHRITKGDQEQLRSRKYGYRQDGIHSIFHQPPKAKSNQSRIQWLAVLAANRYSFRKSWAPKSKRNFRKRRGLHPKARVQRSSNHQRQPEQWTSPEWRAERGKNDHDCRPLDNADEKDILSPNQLTKLWYGLSDRSGKFWLSPVRRGINQNPRRHLTRILVEP